jgi:probable HAF family extracellular repeat protein
MTPDFHRRIRISLLAQTVSCFIVSGTVGQTHRFDHIEFPSLDGGNTSVVAMNPSGMVAGTSGGLSTENRSAFLSDGGRSLLEINGAGLSSSVAIAINNSGQIAGYGCVMNGDECSPIAFRSASNGIAQDLGMLPGGVGVTVAAMNNLGDVIGTWIVGNRSSSQGFLFTDQDGLVNIGHLGGNNTFPAAINDSRIIVGSSRVDALPSHQHAFRWQNGTMFDLGTFGGISSAATDINSAGTTVGWALDAGFSGHAFVHTTERGMQMLDLPKGVTSSSALEINEAGMILVSVEWADSNFGTLVVMPNGSFIEIPLLPGFPTGSALAMNNLGHVVGGNVLVIGSEEIVFGYYWSPQTGTIQLDQSITSDLPWMIFNPVAINDADQILVHGFDGNIEKSALLRSALLGDVNGDRIVNIDDLVGVITTWGACPPSGGLGGTGCHADMDGNAIVDIDDLVSLITHWG